MYDKHKRVREYLESVRDVGMLQSTTFTEGVWVAKELQKAIEVLEKIAYTHPYDESYILGSDLAQKFLAEGE